MDFVLLGEDVSFEKSLSETSIATEMMSSLTEMSSSNHDAFRAELLVLGRVSRPLPI